MSNEHNQPSTFGQLFAKRGGTASLVILILVIAAEICAFGYGRLANRLEREGVVTSATVINVDQYEALQLRDLYPEYRRTYADGDIVTLVDYEYRDAAGEIYTDQYPSRNLTLEEIPEIGSEFEIRYAASDPTVHEVRVGHNASNVAALHWIAAFFGGLTAVYAGWAAVLARKDWNSTTEKRKRRLAELSQE